MRYKFDEKLADELNTKLDEYDDLLIAKDLVDFILNNKTLHKKRFGLFANALTSEVINKEKCKLFEDFVSGTNLSDRAKYFRDLLESEIKKQTKDELDLKTLHDFIENETFFNGTIIKLNIPLGFGQTKKNPWPRKDASRDDLSIAETLVKFILTNERLEKKHFGSYANILASEVIDTENNKLFENFVFNPNLPPRASEFRQTFEKEIKKQTKDKLNLQKLNEAIEEKKIKLNIPKAFKPNQNKKKNDWPPNGIIIKDDDASVAKDLVHFILNNKPLDKKHFSSYANALATEVIDEEDNKLFENFVSNINLSRRASEFRDMFENEIKLQTKDALDLENLNKAIENEIPFNDTVIKLNIPIKFGQNTNKDENFWPPKNIPKEVSEFLNLLTFAVNQINEDELGTAIKEELGELFNEINTEAIYRSMFQHMVDFLQDKKQGENGGTKFWSAIEGANLIKDIRFEIMRHQLSGYRDHLDSVKYKFKENHLLGALDFIHSDETLWLLNSETPWLSSLAVYQSLKDPSNESVTNVRKLKIFIYKWNDLLDNNGEVLSNFKRLDNFLIIISCLQMVGSEDVASELAEKIKNLEQISVLKIIVVAPEDHEFCHQLLLRFQNCSRKVLNINFIDMEEESQKILLEKKIINFQGSRDLSLRKLLNIPDSEYLSEKQIQMLDLDASATELLLRSAEVKIFDQTNDFSALTYNPNKIVSFDSIIKEIASNKYDIFTFFGNDDEIKMEFHKKKIDLIRFKDRSSLNFILEHRLVLLEVEKEAEEFNILCQMLVDYIGDTSDNNKPILHKLKYIGDNQWIWSKSFNIDFYINRYYNPIIIDLLILDLLVENTFPDFIFFSGLDKDEFYKEIEKHYEYRMIDFDRSIFEKNCDITKTEVNLPYNSNEIDLKSKGLENKTAIHWLKLKVLNLFGTQSLRLEWKQSLGNINEIHRRRSKGSREPEDSLIHLNQRLILLTDSPGNGKSCILSRIMQNLKKHKPNSLIIKINLIKLQGSIGLFPVKDKTQFINFLFRILKKTSVRSIENKIMQYKIECFDQIILLCDGLDEINEQMQKNVLDLFKFIIKDTKVSLWITTEEENAKKLESLLYVLSYSFTPLSYRNKVKYLSTFWSTHNKFLERNNIGFNVTKFAEFVIDYVNSIFPEFIDTFLTLRLVAEMYTDVFTNINDNENDSIVKEKIKEINIADVFESFVRHVYEIFFIEKIQLVNNESQAILRDAFSIAYRYLAVKGLCDGFNYDLGRFLRVEQVQASFILLSRIGLAQVLGNPVDGVVCKFIHRSFLEFFATEYICIELKNNSKKEIFWKIFINRILKLKFCRRVFEDKLKNDKELSSLSSDHRIKKIICQLLVQQVREFGTAEALWSAAINHLEHIVFFLSRCLFQRGYSTVKIIIPNLPRNEFDDFKNENDLVAFINNKVNTLDFSIPRESFERMNILLSSISNEFERTRIRHF